MKIVKNVWETMDYGMFKQISGNREISSKVDELEEKMNDGSGYPFNAPIITNSLNQIIDGQHRYEICVKHGRPIQFIIVDNASIDDVVDMNTTNNTWTIIDFIKSYAKRDNKVYKFLEGLLEENGMKPAPLFPLLTDDGKFASEKKVKAGKYDIDIYDAIEKYDYNYPLYQDVINKLKEVGIRVSGNKFLVSGLVRMFNKPYYNHNHFLSQIEKYPMKFRHGVVSSNTIYAMLEDIYNEGLRGNKIRPLNLFN